VAARRHSGRPPEATSGCSVTICRALHLGIRRRSARCSARYFQLHLCATWSADGNSCRCGITQCWAMPSRAGDPCSSAFGLQGGTGREHTRRCSGHRYGRTAFLRCMSPTFTTTADGGAALLRMRAPPVHTRGIRTWMRICANAGCIRLRIPCAHLREDALVKENNVALLVGCVVVLAGLPRATAA